MTAASPDYLKTLTLYYEEEIEGEGYFRAIAERLDEPDHREKMELMAQVETRAAASVRPLLQKYGLTPRGADDLRENGRAQAAGETGAWPALIAGMQQSFPAYMDDFARLEAMAPPEDLPALKELTAHEVAAIAFLDREAEGAADSAQPLRHYLETGTA